jgi:hypothetical protein
MANRDTAVQHILTLIENGDIAAPQLRTLLLADAARRLLGTGDAVTAALGPEATAEAQKSLARDLRQLADANVTPSTFLPTPPASAPPPPGGPIDDDAMKDRITRAFMGSAAFKFCVGVLAVGTILFGVNMGVLMLDTTQAHKIKNEAQAAVDTARAQADNARLSVAGAVAAVQADLPRLAAERLNVQAIQQQVATDIAGRTNPVLADLAAKANAQAGKLAEQATDLAALQKRQDSLNDAVASAQATLAENTRLLERWQNLVSEARLTAADQGLARVVWFILRTESILLAGATALSLLALLVSVIALLRLRKMPAR